MNSNYREYNENMKNNAKERGRRGRTTRRNNSGNLEALKTFTKEDLLQLINKSMNFIYIVISRQIIKPKAENEDPAELNIEIDDDLKKIIIDMQFIFKDNHLRKYFILLKDNNYFQCAKGRRACLRLGDLDALKIVKKNVDGKGAFYILFKDNILAVFVKHARFINMLNAKEHAFLKQLFKNHHDLPMNKEVSLKDLNFFDKKNVSEYLNKHKTKKNLSNSKVFRWANKIKVREIPNRGSLLEFNEGGSK